VEELELYMAWLDMQFGRKPFTPWEDLMYTYTFARWQEVSGEALDLDAYPDKGLDDLLLAEDGSAIVSPEQWQAKRAAIQARLLWGVGELPSVAYPHPPRPQDVRQAGQGQRTATLPIDRSLVARLTYPAGSQGPLPVVIYLHAYLDALGYRWSAGYGWSTPVGERLAMRGFLAVEYDQFGYGTRNRECGIEFYTRHPQQSAMGVMIQDVRAVVETVSGLDIADPQRIFVAGFSLGGAVALYAAALDERIKAVATTCGFAAMRLDAHGVETEGLRRYSHLRPTLPRLGFFAGHETRVPYDYHEILALIAPRPVLVLAPLLDQDWQFEDVAACVRAAAAVYRLLGVEDRLQMETPNDFNRYPPAYQDLVNGWLAVQAEQGEPHEDPAFG
jgi:dienelactone hydrolase